MNKPSTPYIASLRLQPLGQIYLLVALCLALQYFFNLMAHFEMFPAIAGRPINGIITNTIYLLPGILALLATLYFEGRRGLLRITKPYRVIPGNLFWWLVAGVALLPILYLSLYFDDLLYRETLQLYAVTPPDGDTAISLLPIFIRVAICDELFWIGFIYPRLLAAGYTPLKASLAIGFLWGLDYLPYILTGFFLSPGMSAPNLMLGWFAIAPFYIWLYHKTGSAIIIVFFNVCMQFTYNAVPVLPINSGDNSELAMANLITFICFVLVWRFWPNGKTYDLSFLSSQKNQEPSGPSNNRSTNPA